MKCFIFSYKIWVVFLFLSAPDINGGLAGAMFDGVSFVHTRGGCWSLQTFISRWYFIIVFNFYMTLASSIIPGFDGRCVWISMRCPSALLLWCFPLNSWFHHTFHHTVNPTSIFLSPGFYIYLPNIIGTNRLDIRCLNPATQYFIGAYFVQRNPCRPSIASTSGSEINRNCFATHYGTGDAPYSVFRPRYLSS